MPTTVTSTIGATGTYSDPATWEAAAPASLVAVDQIWRGELQNQEFTSAAAVVTIAGIITDATRYVELTTTAGASFVDNVNKLTNALRYNAANGAALRCTGNYTGVGALVTTVDYVRVSKIQISNIGAHARTFTGNGLLVTIDQLLMESQRNCFEVSSSVVVRNCALSVRDAGGRHGFTVLGGTKAFTNCIAVGFGITSSAFECNYGTAPVIINCASFGFTSFNNGTPTGNNNASDVAIGFGSSNQASLVAANQIENIAAIGTLDMRTKAGATLIANGADTTAQGVTTDIVGTARAVPYDIGAWQVAATTTAWFPQSVWIGV